MSDVTIYHPGTEGMAQVPAESLPHWRQSGWLTLDEHNANIAQAAAREQEAAPAAGSKTAAKKE